MNIRDLIARLRTLHACDESIAWLETLDPDAPAYAAWRSCERGDWLVWLVSHGAIRDAVGDRALRIIACDCAEDVLPIWETWARDKAPEHLDAPRNAIAVSRAFAMGKATELDLKAARAAARDAAWAARAARAAVRDAAWAARAAVRDAAWAARDAGDAAWEAQARIVRRHVKWSTVRDALGTV